MRFRIIIWLLIIMLGSSCAPVKNGKIRKNNPDISFDYSGGPPLTIYKTRKNYNRNVAVGLSDDKSQIISYPHPTDVFYKGELAYPDKLNKGYLLDNQGLGANVAFLNISMKKYSKLEDVPSMEELKSMIIDKQPLTELYYCGDRQIEKDEITFLNKIIDEGLLSKCECLYKKE